jgi:hypothetical protein
MPWSHSVAGPASPAEGDMRSPASSPAPDCSRAGTVPGEPGGRAFRVTTPRSDRPDPRWARGSRAGQGASWRRLPRRPHRAGTGRPASGSRPPARGSPACGRGNRSAVSPPTLGLRRPRHAEDAPAGPR